MPDYEKMYHLLFNAITDALTQLEAQNYGDVKDALISAQQKAEEIYITAKISTSLSLILVFQHSYFLSLAEQNS